MYFSSLRLETLTVRLVIHRSDLRSHCYDQSSAFTQHLILNNHNTILQPLRLYDLLAAKQPIFSV